MLSFPLIAWFKKSSPYRMVVAATIRTVFTKDKFQHALLFGFVANNAHTGQYKLNPFNFDHVEVKRVSLFHDGQLVNTRPIETDFTSGDVMQGYWSLHRATNTRYTNGGTLIGLKDYKLGGYELWGYDLAPSQCDEEFVDPKRYGKLELEVEFAKNIPKPLSLCVYLQFDGE